jgi:two-component system OmpR family sensor kinase
MRLRARLSLISAVITTASTMIVGGIGITSQHDSQISLIDKSLNQVVNSIDGKTNAALSEALFAVQQSDISLTLIYYSDPQSPTVLNESNLPDTINPTAAELKAAALKPVTHKAGQDYRLRMVKMLDGEFVVVAASLQEVESRFKTDRWHLILFIFFCLFIAIFITWFFFRRDIKKIESLISAAEEISLGKSEVEIQVLAGNSEIDQLGASLNRMVATLRRTAELEELSSQRMQDFLGDASHELRTPLTVIRGYIELLGGQQFSDEDARRKAFARVASEIARMESLINDLLFLAEFGTTREREEEDVDLTSLLKSHLLDFQQISDGREVVAEIAEDAFILGSASHVSRLLANIFGNISKHTPSDAAVHVVLVKEASKIKLLIEDAGPGLPESAYKNGAQNFQRFDKSRSREAGGSGLGMSIIFAIVQDLGGEITLHKSGLGGLAVEIYFDKLAV